MKRATVSFRMQALLLVVMPCLLNLSILILLLNSLSQAEESVFQHQRTSEILLQETQTLELLEKLNSAQDNEMISNSDGSQMSALKIKFLRAVERLCLRVKSSEYAVNQVIDTLRFDANEFAVLTEKIPSMAIGTELQKAGLKQNQLRADILGHIAKIDRSERLKTRESLDSVTERSQQFVKLATGLVCLNQLVFIFLAAVFAGVTLRRISNLVSDASDLAAGKAVSRVLPPGDELDSVSQTLVYASEELARTRLQQEEHLQKLQRSEENVRTIIEGLPVGVIEVSAVGRIVFVNHTMTEISGYEAEEIFGKRIDDILPGLQWPATPDKASTDVLLQRNLEPPLPVRVSVSEIELQDSNRILLNIADVSEEKRIEQIKQDFISMIIHDLKTPLVAMRGTVQLFEMGVYGELNSAALDQLARMERGTRRLVKLVNDLLVVEKLEAGAIELDFGQHDCSNLVDTSLEVVRDLVANKRIAVKKNVQEYLVYCDGERIVQVLVNLLGNAIKYSPDGGTITVETKQTSECLVIRVVDEGPGVPEHLREAIFERYRQVDDKREIEKKGTGLGLAICKAIIEQHCGQIGCIETDNGKGSVFWFSLPVSNS
jgi:signal transduction histidine kinase